MAFLLKDSRFGPARTWAGLAAGLAAAIVVVQPASGADTKAAAKDDGKSAAKKPEAGKTNAPPKVVVIPKSVFTDDIKVGKDPFFPNSIRRNPPPPEPPKPPPGVEPTVPTKVEPPKPPPPPPDPFKDFSLRGISGTATRKFASINTKVKTYVFKQGERLEVKTPEGSARLRCVQIKDESVVVTIEGKPDQKELFLRSGP